MSTPTTTSTGAVTTATTSTSTSTSGELPLLTYHRAQAVGEGSYGSVVTVYDDDGNEYALKLFEDDDDDDDDVGLSVGALREVSILRLLRGGNSHPNIIELHDVQTGFEEADEAGAGTAGCLAVAMPLFSLGSLTNCLSLLRSKQQKVLIAHGILQAVAHLHESSIIHRDIKCDNILLRDTNDGTYQPVLIDFSLSKIMCQEYIPLDGVLSPASSNSSRQNQKPSKKQVATEITTHTPTIGTPTYRAPEVVEQRDYGLPSDLWSVGVVLLELLRGQCLEVEKDKSALKLVLNSLETLPTDQPFPNLIRGLLDTDPEKRLTAREALDSTLFRKYQLSIEPSTFRKLDLKKALPLGDGEDDENLDDGDDRASSNSSNKKGKKGPNKVDKKLQKRLRTIKKVCDDMEWNNPMTAVAALNYSIQMSELCDVDDDDDRQALLDCIVVAHKFFELDLADLDELNETGGPLFESWDRDEYVDNESTIFMMMDFCLYPR